MFDSTDPPDAVKVIRAAWALSFSSSFGAENSYWTMFDFGLTLTQSAGAARISLPSASSTGVGFAS